MKQKKKNSVYSFGMLTKSVADENFKPVRSNNKNFIFSKPYTTFIHLAGIDVYPILLNATRDELRGILSKVNGVMLPGGMSSVFYPDKSDPSKVELSWYSRMVKAIMEEAKEMNDRGDYFPVFGICLGFEAMVLVESDNINIVEKKHTGLNYNASLTYCLEHEESKFLAAIPRHVRDYLRNVDCTHNYHEYMVDAKKMLEDPKVSNIYKIVSTSKSMDKAFSFVSIIEGRKYPFYAVQFHPELGMNTNYPGLYFPNFNMAAEVGRSIMWFMLEEARKSFHDLEKEDMKKLLVNDPGTVICDANFGVPFHLWD